MNVVLSCIHYPVAAGRFLYFALKRLGHSVVSVGPAVGSYLPWANGRSMEAHEWKPDVALPYDGKSLQYFDTDAVLDKTGFEPELVIQMDAQLLLRQRPKCRNVLYAIDNHVAPYGAYNTFDDIYISHSWGHMSNQARARWLPCAYDPVYHNQFNAGERPLQVGMLGNGYEARQEIINALHRNGVGVSANTGLVYEAYNAFYNQCKVALVKSVQDDLAMRVFENMAQGCLVVADRAPDMERLGLVDGVHYLGYSDTAGAVRAVKGALADWDYARCIADIGREFIQPHTWQARAQAIVGNAHSALDT